MGNCEKLSVTFHIETNHLIYTPNQMTGFYMKCKIWLKCVKVVGHGNKISN